MVGNHKLGSVLHFLALVRLYLLAPFTHYSPLTSQISFVAGVETTDTTEYPKQAMNSINWHKCFHFITQGLGLGWFSLVFFC